MLYDIFPPYDFHRLSARGLNYSFFVIEAAVCADMEVFRPTFLMNRAMVAQVLIIVVLRVLEAPDYVAALFSATDAAGSALSDHVVSLENQQQRYYQGYGKKENESEL